MGPYGIEKFKTLPLQQITVESFQIFPIFFPNGRYKIAFGIFEIFKIEILTNCIRLR